MSRGEESINESLSHACSAYCDFYKNLMLVSNMIKKSLFYTIIGAYTCTFSNNLSFVWYFGFWAHSLVGLVTKKSFEWQKKNLLANIYAVSILSENKTLLIEEIRSCGRAVRLIMLNWLSITNCCHRGLCDPH